jgi:hypothetical protein
MVSEHATDMSSFIENICVGYLLRRIRAAEARDPGGRDPGDRDPGDRDPGGVLS